MTRDELIALLQQQPDNEVKVYVPMGDDGVLILDIESVDRYGESDAITLDTEEADSGEVEFTEAQDRRGFIVHVNGEQVGEPVDYDGYGWSGIDATRELVVELTKALGGTVVESEATA